jgi:hypothetical protein
MNGGIFDHKTTLGEYDVLANAPAGTTVQAGLAEYIVPPGMGATVEQATAGMGATVQEAFAGGRGLREYITRPLSGLRGLNDYVQSGEQVQYWGQSPQGQAILLQIRDAAQRLTAQRRSQGLPIDAKFRQDLTRAATQVVQGEERDVSMAASVPPLTKSAAPFPGVYVGDVGGVAGQPVGIQGAQEYIEEDDAGIFA